MSLATAPGVDRLKFPPLYPKQAAFVHDTARYTVCFASTKSGKSVGLLVWLLGRAWEIGAPGRDFYWIEPTYSVAKVMYLRMARWLQRADPEREKWHANESQLFIQIDNGGILHFKGAERPDLLFGPDSWGTVIDEGTRVREQAWHAVRSTVTKTQAPIKIIGNMRGRRNWMYRLWARGVAGDPLISSHLLTAYDAVDGGVLQLSEIDDARSMMPEHVFRELYMAEAMDDGANPFGADAIEDCVMSVPLAPGPAVAFGVDLGRKADWTVIIGLNENRDVCHFDRFRLPWPQAETAIVAACTGIPTAVDSTGLGDVMLAYLQRAAHATFNGYVFSAPSKQKLFEGLAVTIQNRAIGIPEGPIVTELLGFEFVETRTNTLYAAGEGLHDDCTDALALSDRMWQARPKRSTVELWEA